MNEDKNRKPGGNLRWLAFQSLLAGIVIIMVVVLLCFIFFENGASSHSGSYSTGRGLGFLIFGGFWGVWMIVRGIIYLIRALSGNEQYAKSVEDAMEKFETRQGAMMRKRAGNASMRNVLVLLVWVFLFLAVVGGIAIAYSIWTRPR